MANVKIVFCVSLLKITAIVCKPGNFNINGDIHHNQYSQWNVHFHETNNKQTNVSSGMFIQLIVQNKTIHNSTEEQNNLDLSDVDMVGLDNILPSPGSPSSKLPDLYRASECADCNEVVNVKNELIATLTDMEEEQFIVGLEINLNINETLDENDSPDKLISAPGCPFSSPIWGMITHPMNRNVWVHYGNPPKCFLAGFQGPCPTGSKLAPQRNSSQGICTCACYFKAPPTPELQNTNLLNEISNPFLDNLMPFCFNDFGHHTFYRNKCYTILTQGPCDKSEVLLMNEKTNSPTCQARDCVENETSIDQLQSTYSFSFKYNGTCQKYGTTCQNPEDLDKDHKYFLEVQENSPYPSCILRRKVPGVPYAHSYGISPDLQKLCTDAGMKYSDYLKTCISNVRRAKSIG